MEPLIAYDVNGLQIGFIAGESSFRFFLLHDLSFTKFSSTIEVVVNMLPACL